MEERSGENVEVESLNLSLRARRALRRLGVNTLGELAGHSRAELSGIRNFAAVGLAELERCLENYGLAFREDGHVLATNYAPLSKQEAEPIRSLAEAGKTRLEISEALGISLTKIGVAAKRYEIKIFKTPRATSRVDDRNLVELAYEGRDLEDMREYFGGVSRWRISQKMDVLAVERKGVRTPLRDIWLVQKKAQRRDSERVYAQEKRRLAKKIAAMTLYSACQRTDDSTAEGFAGKKTAEYNLAHPRTSYATETLNYLFVEYFRAREDGRKISLSEFGEMSGLHFALVRRIFQDVGLKPLGRRTRK